MGISLAKGVSSRYIGLTRLHIEYICQRDAQRAEMTGGDPS